MTELLPPNLERIGDQLNRAWRPTPDEARIRWPHRLRLRGATLIPAVALVGLLATVSYGAYFSDPTDKAINDQLRQAATTAKPLSPALLAARARWLAADTTAAACIAKYGPHAQPCAQQEAAATAIQQDPTVRDAIKAEALLVDAAWYCVQQKGYNVNGGSIAPGAQNQPGIWEAFAACKIKVGVPD